MVDRLYRDLKELIRNTKSVIIFILIIKPLEKNVEIILYTVMITKIFLRNSL